ncbi:MAG: pseudouridine synthase [Candidatus Bathyarchaeota archaeon]|nr:pseudouridine synthase [Candidatus Bathyarchaeota archaeon]
MSWFKSKEWFLRKIRGIADYQFGLNVGKILFPEGVSLKFSKKTGRVREVYLNGKLLATLKPTTGSLSLTIEGFKRIIQVVKPPRFRVIVKDEVKDFIKKGGDVFAKHVDEADVNIRPKDDVVVVDKQDNILAVGKAILSGREIKLFNRGVAVKVKHYVEEKLT